MFLAETIFYKWSSWENNIYNSWEKTTFIYNQYRLTKQKINTVIGTWIFHTKNMFGFCWCHLKHLCWTTIMTCFSGKGSISRITNLTPSQNLQNLSGAEQRDRPGKAAIVLLRVAALCRCVLDFSCGKAFFFNNKVRKIRIFLKKRCGKKTPIYKQVTWGMISLPQKIRPILK